MKNKLMCKDCKSRYVGCHAECEEYKAFRKEKDELNQCAYKKRSELDEIIFHSKSGFQRMTRKIRRSKIK